MLPRLIGLLGAFALLLSGSTAFADPLDDEEVDGEKRYRASVFFAPVPLVTARTLWAGAELRYTDKVSFAVIGSIGNPAIASTPFGTSRYTFLGIAGQARRYLIGDFKHGLNLGAQVGVAWSHWYSTSLFLPASGFGFGGFVGYKLIAKFGATIDLNAGMQVYGIGRSRSQSDPSISHGSFVEPKSAPAFILAPLIQLNFGWSF